MRKIIHLSDLHIGYQNLGRRFQSIVDNIIFTKEPAKNYVIVITGDLVERPSYYEEARGYIRQLEDKGFIVLTVPGNHDYGTGLFASPDYMKCFKETFFDNPRFNFKSSDNYPKLDIIGEIAFIGLDSMEAELNILDRYFAQGELGGPQLQHLEQILKDIRDRYKCKYTVIYLHHHPFDPLPLHHLKDSEELGRLLMKYKKTDEHGNEVMMVDAILYGHNHEGKIRNGKWNIMRCYDAGSSTCKDNMPGYHRVIDFNRDARLDYDGAFHCKYIVRGVSSRPASKLSRSSLLYYFNRFSFRFPGLFDLNLKKVLKYLQKNGS